MVIYMNKKILLDKILEYLIGKEKIEIPEKLEDKIKLWEKLVSTKEIVDVPSDILVAEDKFLRLDLINRKLTNGEMLKTVDMLFDSKLKFANKISLWKGDITTIYSDVLVNSIRKDFLDINNDKIGAVEQAIFTRSGMRLKMKCKEIMKETSLDETEVLVTRAYNLPSDYIIHVVTPVVGDELTDENKVSLKMSYLNVLECAKNNVARTIVLPCIGTGMCNYPMEEAANIAVETVLEFLEKNNSLVDRIILNVFDDKTFDYYKSLLLGEEDA